MSSLDKTRGEHAYLLRREETRGSYGSAAAADKDTSDDSEVKQHENPAKVPTPLPMKQLLVIFAMRLAEPIAYSQVFPYINEMMEDIGAVDDPLQAGYYSGVTESVFAIAELLTVMRWGSLSDQVGRKPVLLIGFTGAVLSTVLFGLSKSFIWALVTRCLAGALSGNTAVLLSAVGDITDETNQARAYTMFGVAFNVAQIAGPSIGGTFANPTVTFPESLGAVVLFQRFPFLLPCIISATVALIAAGCGAMFFKETFMFRIYQTLHREPSQTRSAIALHNQSDQSTTWSIAKTPLMLSVLAPFFLLSVLNTSVTVVFSLFAYTPVLSGGLSRDPEEIGLAIAYSGLAGAMIQTIILPELQRRYGTITLYRFFMSLWPLVFLMFPVLNAIARHTSPWHGVSAYVTEERYSSHPAGLAVWCVIGILLTLSRLAAMSFSLNLILTKNASSSTAVLGKVFALSQFVNCFARSVAPSFVSSLFSLSEERNLLGGNFVWVVMCAISLLGMWATLEVRDGSLEKRNP